MTFKVSNNQKEQEQTSHFRTRDVHRDLHCPGLRLIPSDNKLPDICSPKKKQNVIKWYKQSSKHVGLTKDIKGPDRIKVFDFHSVITSAENKK